MSYCAIDFAGQEAHLHGAKMVWFPSDHILCAADIHFEKGTFFDRFGTFLPPYDTEETLSCLEYWVHHFKPRTFIALGDSFHDASAGERFSQKTLARLNALITHVPEWIWITGNHDPAIHREIVGVRKKEHVWQDIHFRHEYEPCKEGAEISGHYHPKAKLSLRGHRISAPCFVRHKERLILPSFGTYTGGLCIEDAAFRSLIPADAHRRIYLAYQKKVFAVG